MISIYTVFIFIFIFIYIYIYIYISTSKIQLNMMLGMIMMIWVCKVRGISDFIRQFRTSFSLGFDGGYCHFQTPVPGGEWYGCIHIGNWEPVGATIRVSQPHDNIHIGLIVKTIGKIVGKTINHVGYFGI